MANRRNWDKIEDDTSLYEVVHPLDDVPEQKRNYQTLGRMKMTPVVRLSLIALRGYLILMILLVFYRVLSEAGAFGHHK